MNFSIAQTELVTLLNNASRALPKKATLPILSCFVLEASFGSTLAVKSSNLETFYRGFTENVTVNELGSIALPGKELLKFVQTAGKKELIFIQYSEGDSKATITAGNLKTSFEVLPVDQFPVTSDKSGFESVSVMNSDTLKESIDLTSFAASTDETRPVLTAILMKFNNSKVEFVAADSFRLAYRTLENVHNEQQNKPCGFLVPAIAAGLFSKSLPTSKNQTEVEISYNQSKHTVLFSWPGNQYFITCVEGNYPNFESIIPKSKDITSSVALDSASAIQVCKAALLNGSDKPLIVNMTQNSVTFNDVPLISGKITLKNSFNKRGLNVRFLEEAFKAIGKESAVLMEFPSNPASPIQISKPGYKMIIMPMHLATR